MVRSADHVLLATGVFVFFALIVLLFPVGLAPRVLAQVNTTDNVTINITISEFAEITVVPTNFTITAINPGADSAAVNYSIKNTGSTNITNIFANVDTVVKEQDNTDTADGPEDYAAGGLIFINNDSGGAYYHAGRLEWNLTSPLTGEVLNLTSGTLVNGNFSRGWYRNGSNTYLWKVENGTDANCSTTGTRFWIKGSPENATSDLERDFSSGVVVEATFDESTTEWGLHSMTTGPLTNYCVATYHTCEKIFIYKYDKRGTLPDADLDGCTQSSYLHAATVLPGFTTSFTLHASVPQGLPAGETNVSILTISAT